MSRHTLPVTVDMRTNRFIKFATAVKAVGLLPDEASGLLLNHARSARLLCESGDWPLAFKALDGARTICNEVHERDHRVVRDAALDHITSVRSAITKEK